MVIPSANNNVASNNNPLSRKQSNCIDTSTDVTGTTVDQSQSGDALTLSLQAQIFEHLEAKIQASSGTDTAKIELIKQQITNGSYRIDDMHVAESVLKQERLFD